MIVKFKDKEGNDFPYVYQLGVDGLHGIRLGTRRPDHVELLLQSKDEGRFRGFNEREVKVFKQVLLHDLFAVMARKSNIREAVQNLPKDIVDALGIGELYGK